MHIPFTLESTIEAEYRSEMSKNGECVGNSPRIQQPEILTQLYFQGEMDCWSSCYSWKMVKVVHEECRRHN